MSKKKRISTMQVQPKAAPGVVCDDIEHLTFAQFLKAQAGNLSALIISGIPTPQQLFGAWMGMLSEYYSLINSQESMRYVRIVCQIEAVNCKINVVTALCEALKQWYNPVLVEQLRKWEYDLPFSDESLLVDIKRVETELGNDRFKLEKLRLEYKAEEKHKEREAQKNTGRSTKENYMRTLYAIEKYRQQRYPPDKLSLYEFAMFYNELQEYAAEISKIHGSK